MLICEIPHPVLKFLKPVASPFLLRTAVFWFLLPGDCVNLSLLSLIPQVPKGRQLPRGDGGSEERRPVPRQHEGPRADVQPHLQPGKSMLLVHNFLKFALKTIATSTC